MRFPLSGVVRNSAGDVIPSAVITIYESGTLALVSAYAEASGGVDISSVTADSGGRFIFYIDEADYNINQLFKLKITSAGYGSTYVDPIAVTNLIDGHDHVASTLDGGSIETPINTIQVRRGTAAELASCVLEDGELGWTSDTHVMVVGDGSTPGGIAQVLVTSGGFEVDPVEGIYAGSGATRVQMKPGIGIWAGADAIGDAPFSVTTAGALIATSGLLGGWIVTSNLMKSAESAERLELDQTNMRITIIDATEASKVVMGYLEDLPKHDGTGSWGAGDYGFWAAAGDQLRIDGDVVYESGDWIVENDGSYLIQNGAGNVIVRLGTDTAEKGLFIYDTAGVQLAKFISDEIFIGDDAGQYLRYTVAGGLVITGSMTITPGDINGSDIVNDLGWTNDDALDAFMAGTYASDIADLYSQIDGVVVNWFYEGVPTLANDPAVAWNTNELKDDHIGDLYYDKLTGYAYRFILDGGVYQWFLIPDAGVASALAAAATAQDTADGKRRVFVYEPTTPYEVGDLWSAGPTGDLKRCMVARAVGAFQAGDWTLASKYTDDTAAIAAANTAATALANAAIAQGLLDDIASDAEITPVEKLIAKQLWDAIVVEGTATTGTIPVMATALAVADTAFDTAYSTLNIYLNTTLGVFNNMAASTSITRSTWDTNWKGYYNARTVLLNAIAAKAATMATWSSITGTGKPADNATIGAIWGSNLSNIPATLGTPTGSGLFLSSGYMGYYSGGVWSSYIKNDGTWYFKGNGSKYINWNGSNLFVKGSILTGSLYLGDGVTASGTLTLAIADGQGDCFINSGKTDFTNAEAGFILGLDDSDGNKAKFYVGDAANYINWNGSTLAIGGDIIATGNIQNGAVTGGKLPNVTAGDGYIIHSDVAASTISASYVKLKEAQVNRVGSIRVAFTLSNTVSVSASAIIYGRVYKNGVAVGTEQHVHVVNDGVERSGTFSQDFTGVVIGDLFQVYAKAQYTHCASRVSAFIVSFDDPAFGFITLA
jgi:hypothetical protein